MKLLDTKLLAKMREQKLLSFTLLLLTLSIGIVIGTLINTGVHAQRGQSAAPDATPPDHSQGRGARQRNYQAGENAGAERG